MDGPKAQGDKVAAAYTSMAEARALLHSRANFSRFDDELTTRHMLASEQSPVISNLLSIARRNLAALEKERNDIMSAVYTNSPQTSGLSPAHWTQEPIIRDKLASVSSPTSVLFPESSEKSRIILPKSPPRQSMTCYPSRTLPSLSNDTPVLQPHKPRKAEEPQEPRNAMAEIRTNAETQIRSLQQKGLIDCRARLVIEVEMDPAPEVVKIGNNKSLKYQKTLLELTRAVTRLKSEGPEWQEFSILQFCTVTCKDGRPGAFEVRLVVHARGVGGKAESVLVHSKIATRKLPKADVLVEFLCQLLPRVVDVQEAKEKFERQFAQERENAQRQIAQAKAELAGKMKQGEHRQADKRRNMRYLIDSIKRAGGIETLREKWPQKKRALCQVNEAAEMTVGLRLSELDRTTNIPASPELVDFVKYLSGKVAESDNPYEAFHVDTKADKTGFFAGLLHDLAEASVRSADVFEIPNASAKLAAGLFDVSISVKIRPTGEVFYDPLALASDLKMQAESKKNVFSGAVTRHITNITLLTDRKFLTPKEIEELRLLKDYEDSWDDLQALDEYEKGQAQDFEMVRRANQLYADPKTKNTNDANDGVIGIFGDQCDFFAGLHHYAGKPFVAGNEKLKKAMYAEFMNCIDPRIRNIATKNYGGLDTDLQTEWEFAVCPFTDKSSKLYPGQTGNTSWDATRGRYHVGRNPREVKEIMKAVECKTAGLIECEVIGLRLYTGPAYMPLNGSLREARYSKGKRNCLPVIAGIDTLDFDEEGFTTVTVDDIKRILEGSGGMRSIEAGKPVFGGWTSQEIKALFKNSKRISSYFPNQNKISKDQVLKFQMLEGGCGKRDYGPLSCAKCAPGVDCFSTTIAVINSAILKLSKVTPLPTSGLLYRGLNLLSFPHHLLAGLGIVDGDTDVLNVAAFQDGYRGFVEFGFSSATPDKRVAWEYSGAAACKGNTCSSWNEEKGFCEAHRPTILEIQTGQIDRGANLKWVSQFPAEDENGRNLNLNISRKVLIPLSNFSIVGMRREASSKFINALDSGDQLINVLSIKLNINLNAQNLEQLRQSRQKSCLDMVDELLTEARQYILSGSNIISKSRVEAECKKIRMKIQNPPAAVTLKVDSADYFNDADRYLESMNELFADFRALMLSAISELQAHAERLMFEPECRARDRQIQTTVEQAIRISNRIKDRKAFRSDKYHQLQDSNGVAPKETQEEEQKLLRLYDLASIVMTPEQDMELCTFVEMLTEKGELFASTYGKEEDAIALYDEALVILGYETSQKPFEGNNFRQVAELLNKKGLVLIQRGKRCSENVGDFEAALESFQKGRLVTEARLDQDQIVNFDLQLSADILENEGILLYRELQRPKDAQSKLEESLARKVAIVGANGPGVDGTLKHLWVIIKGLSDFNIDIHKDEAATEELLSRCSSIFRVHQILCKRRPSDLLSGLDGIKSSINSFFEQFFDTNTISEVVAALSGREDGLSSSSPAIYEWGAAALRAVFVVGAINGKKYENKEVDIAIKALLSTAERQGDHPGVALQTMETFLLLRDQGSSAVRSNLRQEIILAILVILGVHKSHADVRLPALEVLQYLVRKYDDTIFNATDRAADGCKNERVANVSDERIPLQVAVDANSKLVDQLKNVILSLERVGGKSESGCEYASTMSRVQADLSVAFSNSKKLEEMARAAAATKAAEPKEYLDVDMALEDSRILKLAISEGAVELLLSCLDNVVTADPALQILVMISEHEHEIVAESFAKSVAYADGQVIIQRCMQAHATHPAIRMNGRICLEKCNDWFTKMEVNKGEITTRCSAAIKKVVRRAAASANASTKAALSIKMCHDGNLESAKMARTEAAEAYRSAGKDPAKELANVDELISEIEIAADALLLNRIANLTSAQGSALMALKVEEKNNYWMTTTQGGPVSFFSFELLDKDGDGLLTLEEYKAGFDVLDMDNDGFISAKEFGCASGAPFKLLDKDGDGKLSRAEYEAGFKLFDIDGDGQISKEEFNGAVAPKFSFEALDSDCDGRITQEDYNKGFDMLDVDKDGFRERETASPKQARVRERESPGESERANEQGED